MKRIILIIAGILALSACAPQQKDFYTIKAGDIEAVITPYGGRIVSLFVPDRDGVKRDIVLGFDKLEDYYPENNQTDFGAAIGRYANRIDHGHLEIDGVNYQLPQNNYGHCLHGGPEGWQYKLYKVVKADKSSLKLLMDSPDGDANFPGHVKAFVTYTLTPDNCVDIQYEAVTDAPTVINMTNHAYFNLHGDGNKDILDCELYLNASNYTPVDDTFMTTGEIAPVDDTPFDFRTPKPVGQDIDADNEQIANGHGYDHNWVLDTDRDISRLAAALYCEQTGIELRVYTDEPGIQVYAGNFLDGTVTGKGGVVYNRRTAICLETQKYPDTPNKPEWPSAELRPGDKYQSHTVFAFGVK
ncbi:MAG: galactose mutarotase [Bacteroidales bacterium]|nr:galactose mutarotase [Bacteroidales bacterium]